MDEQNDAARSRLTVTSRADGSGLVVRLSGELDLATVGELAAPLKDLMGRPPQSVVLELGDLAFMDSSGVAVLIRIANHFERLETRGAQPAVRRVIEVLGLSARVGLRQG